MRPILLAAAIPLVCLSINSSATAGVITQTTPGLSQDLGDFTPFDINALPFNSADGTLIGVSIELKGTFTPAVDTASTTAQPTFATLASHAFVFATNGGGTTTIDLGSQTFLTPNPAGGQENILGTPTPVDFTVNFSDLSAFENLPLTSQLLVEYGFRTSTTLSGSGSDLTSFTGQAILTYETASTTSVPEPVTLSILGAGLAGTAAFRRRKKATNV